MVTYREPDGSRADAHTGHLQEEAGFALVTSLIAILVVSVLATAGWNLSNFELDTSRDFKAGTDAFYLADRGLNRYLATDAANLTSPASYTFEDGTATVRVERLVAGMDNDEQLHRVTSTGEYDAPGGGTVQRTVSTVMLATPLMPTTPTGTYVSNAGVEQNGGPSATYDGNDHYQGNDSQCDAAGVGGGVRGIVAESFEVSGGGPPGNNGNAGNSPCDGGANVQGSPPGPECRSGAVQDFMTASQWQTLKGIRADHTITDGDAFPSTVNDGDSRDWEVVRVDGESYSLSNGSRTGQGILIVEGDFTFDGNFTWNGIILAGGTVTGNGTQTVSGSMVTGLDELLGEDVSSYNVGNGTKSYRFNSCDVYRASTASYQVSRVPSTLYGGS